MRLLTYNIHSWKTEADEPNLEQLIDLLKPVAPDVVGLNEVIHPLTIRNSLDPTPALARLAQALGLDFVFGPCLRWPANDTMPERSYGNALLSRWPIIASAAHHLTPVEGKEQRGLLEGRLLLPTGETFTVYVTHLDYQDDEGRLIQWRAARSWTSRDRNRPHALMGDFNAIDAWDHAEEPERLARLAQDPVSRRQLGTPDGSKLISQIEKAGYVDSMKLAGKPGHGTVPPSTDPMRIDYIWLSQPLASALKTIEVIYEKPGQEASDHRPVWVDLDLSALGDSSQRRSAPEEMNG